MHLHGVGLVYRSDQRMFAAQSHVAPAQRFEQNRTQGYCVSLSSLFSHVVAASRKLIGLATAQIFGCNAHHSGVRLVSSHATYADSSVIMDLQGLSTPFCSRASQSAHSTRPRVGVLAPAPGGREVSVSTVQRLSGPLKACRVFSTPMLATDQNDWT